MPTASGRPPPYGGYGSGGSSGSGAGRLSPPRGRGAAALPLGARGGAAAGASPVQRQIFRSAKGQAAAAAGAQAAAAAATGAAGAGAPVRQDRQSLAVGMLVEGRPQAYIDFFELTDPAASSSAAAAAAAAAAGGEPAAGGPGSGAQQAAAELDFDSDGLLLLRDQLVAADAAIKAGDARAAFDAYRQLGRYFTQRMQLERAAMFYSKCRQVAAGAAWPEGELESSCALGLVYERLGQPDAAVACHERCLELALAAPGGDASAAHVDEARRTLVHVYAQQAEQREKAGDLEAAAAFLHKCLDAAERCGDAAAAGAASHRLGLLAAARGRWEEAAGHQAAYVARSKEAGDAAAEGAACRAYAECLRRLGDSGGAIAALESYLQLQEAARDADARGPALVCCQLGCLHHARGDAAAAVGAFERFFELARALQDARLLAAARVNLGAARAALRVGEYMGMAADDLPRLLEAKGLGAGGGGVRGGGGG